MSLADKYDVHHSDCPEKIPPLRAGWPRSRRHAVCYPKGEGEALLEIGCGSGWTLYYMRDRYKTLYGAEISAVGLKNAKRNLVGYDFRPLAVADEHLDGVASSSIDRVLSTDVIEHIVDVYLHVAEVYRVLKPGGNYIVNTPNVAHIKHRLEFLMGRFPHTGGGFEYKGGLYDRGHLHYFTYGSLEELLRRQGFEIVGRLGFGPFGRAHDVFPTLISQAVQVHARKPTG